MKNWSFFVAMLVGVFLAGCAGSGGGNADVPTNLNVEVVSLPSGTDQLGRDMLLDLIVQNNSSRDLRPLYLGVTLQSNDTQLSGSVVLWQDDQPQSSQTQLIAGVSASVDINSAVIRAGESLRLRVQANFAGCTGGHYLRLDASSLVFAEGSVALDIQGSQLACDGSGGVADAWSQGGTFRIIRNELPTTAGVPSPDFEGLNLSLIKTGETTSLRQIDGRVITPVQISPGQGSFRLLINDVEVASWVYNGVDLFTSQWAPGDVLITPGVHEFKVLLDFHEINSTGESIRVDVTLIDLDNDVMDDTITGQTIIGG